MKSLLMLFVIGFLTGCDSSSQSPSTSFSRPHLPEPSTAVFVSDTLLPLSLESQKAKEYFNDVLNHPWIIQQPDVMILSPRMVDDIRSIQNFSCTGNEIVKMLQQIQKPLEKLPISFPSQYYRILNIPEPSFNTHSCPIPFQIHQRIYMGDTDLGLPFYADIRAFALDPSWSPQEREDMIDKILSWHFEMLEQKEQAFHPCCLTKLAFIGRGNRHPDHADLSHGLALHDRGVFLALFPTEQTLYLLHADASWSTFSRYQDIFLQAIGEL